jgi:acyl-CoA thioester hydrolase
MGEAYTHQIRVRFGECDPQGVVFNAHYLAYFDISITELWRAAFGSYQSMVDRGFDVVVAEARLGFSGPARFDDQLTLSVLVTKLGNTSILTHHEVLRDGQSLVQGDMCHVLVELPSLTKTPLPRWVREGLAPWEAPPPNPPSEAPAPASPARSR